MEFVTGIMFWDLQCWINDRQEYPYPDISGFLVLSNVLLIVIVNKEQWFPHPSNYISFRIIIPFDLLKSL